MRRSTGRAGIGIGGNGMILRDLMAFMQTTAPKELAEEWDNVGLLFGDPATEIDTVVVALDATRDAIAYAKEQGAQVIVSHHPLLFSPVRAIQAPSALYALASNNIACFAAHTNLDAAPGGVNDALAAALGLQQVQEAFGGIGRVGELAEDMTPTAFAEHVKTSLGVNVQVKAGTEMIRTVALVGGAGGDFAADCAADAYVTGEIKHHEWLDIPSAMTVVAAGHYATEVVVVPSLAKRLQEAFPTLRVLAYEGCAPYSIV